MATPHQSLSTWRRPDLSGSWETSIVSMPCSSTPARPPHQAITVVRHGPRTCQSRGLPRYPQFRGSIAEPEHSLFTLRRGHRCPTTQNSLPGAGQLSRTGLLTRKVSTKGFRSASLHPFLLSQAFLTQWHTGVVGWLTDGGRLALWVLHFTRQPPRPPTPWRRGMIRSHIGGDWHGFR